MFTSSRRKKKTMPRRLSFDCLEDRRVLSATFSPTANMLFEHGHDFTLTTLCDGRVLAAGGTNDVNILGSAEVYDPGSGTWMATGSMNVARAGHSATLLPNCTVLVAAGSGLNSAELYDPIAGTWSATGSMAVGRSRATSALLNNGKVLVAAGGVPGPGDTFGTASAELYDPATGSWSPTGSLNVARMDQVGVSLSDGRVLIAGGMDKGVTFRNFKSTEIYDPALGTWSLVGDMAIGRRAAFTLTTLPSGEVLVAGGGTNWTGIATNKAELFDPNTGTWTPTTQLPATRNGHSATLLTDGTVLVAGGNEHPVDFGPGTYLDTALIYDPVAATWASTTNTMGEVRASHRGLRLADGNVLIAGGYNGAAFLTTAELYTDTDTQCVPVPDGLVSWWPGDGSANDINDGNHGTLEGGTTFGSGIVDQAFLLDGVDDSINVGNPPNLQVSLGDFTVDAWVNFSALSHPPGTNNGHPAGDMSIVDKMSANGIVNGDGWRLIKQNDNHFWFGFGGGSVNGLTPTAPTTVISTTTVTTGTWYHVAAVKSGSEFALYVNGVKEASKLLPAFTDTQSANLIIGGNALYGAHLNGRVDEAEIYDRALSDAEIQAIYGAGSAGKCRNRPPIAEAGGPYSVPEGGGTTLNGAGSSDPDGDALTYAWDLDNDATFETSGVAPTFSADGRDGPGSQIVVLRVSDGIHSVDDTATVNITNVAPTAVGDDYVLDEDQTLDVPSAGVLTNDTDPGADTLTAMLVDGSGPSHGTLDLQTDGSFTYTPEANWHGTDTFQYQAFDGDDYSEPATVTIVVASVNDAPTFTPGSDQVRDEDAGPQTVANWATNIRPGPPLESGQSVWFVVKNDNHGLFSQQPAVSSDGTLSYTPAANAYGGAIVTVVLHDNGGTENGGVDTSEPQTFIIIVNPVIDAVMDVKPGNGDEIDPINLGANGLLPIAIYSGGSDHFDARTVDIDSIRLNGRDIAPVRAAFEDMDGDGVADLVLHFAISDIRDRGVFNPSIVDSQLLTLTAEIEGGEALGPDLIARDWIRLVPSPGKRKAEK